MMSPKFFTLLLLLICITSAFGQASSSTTSSSSAVAPVASSATTAASAATVSPTATPSPTTAARASTKATPTTTMKNTVTASPTATVQPSPTTATASSAASSTVHPEVCVNSTVNCKKECCADPGWKKLKDRNVTIHTNCTMGGALTKMFNTTSSCHTLCGAEKECNAGVILRQSPWLLLLTFVTVFAWFSSSWN